MKDLKSLYLTAKISGGQKDINAYTEAVNELLNSNPNDYILNLEYIISSDIGLQTFDTFIEKYGLSIACYDNVMECLEKCIEKCSDTNRDDSEYQKKKEKLKEFKENHQNCFTMYEYFSDELPDNYLSTYYSFNDKGIQRRRLPIAMLDRFGEAGIPDILVTSESLNCVKPTLDFLVGKTILSLNERFNSPVFQQWMAECVNDVLPSDIINPYKDTLQSIVESMRSRNNSVYRESVITGKNDICLEYSEEEIHALQELITFKEYQVVSCENVDRALAIQNEIYSLYEEFDGLIDEAGNFTAIVESRDPEVNKASKEIANRIIKLSKEVHNRAKESSKEVVKESNKGVGIFSRMRVFKPIIYRYIGNKNDPFGFGVKSKIIKSLPDEVNSDGKYFENIKIYLKFQFQTSANPKQEYRDKLLDIILKTLNDALSNMKDKVSISDKDVESVCSKDNPLDKDSNKSFNEYYVTSYYLTYTIPLFINKENVCKNIDTSIFESFSFEENVINYLLEYTNDELSSFTELKSWVNTRNKKTGDIPDYIKRNHDVGYGEDEPTSDDNTDDVSLSDFERPSAKTTDKTASVEPLGDEGEEEPEANQPVDKSAVNNYYYYTYNNSLNKNSHSFNRDNSTHDNHSKHDHSVTNDSSVHNSTRRINDDHSTNKRINSHDYSSSDIYDEVEGESAKPWELNVFGTKQYTEAVGDADDMKPESDHPVKDILTDVDRKLVGQQQKAKKKIQDIQNAGRAFMKPINRSKAWINNILSNWKDNDETKVKEKMADPHARNNLFSAIAWSIKAGSFVKAGLLLNPVFLFLSITKGVGKNKRMQRIRNEMIGELKTELEIIDEKIKDADAKGDKKAKYQLMRLKNEINKKYIRVGGGKGWSKIL